MRFPVKIVLLLLWTVCVAQECNDGPPRKSTEILTGTWSESVYQEGTRATYKCRPGYRTLGSIVMECKNGKWESLYPNKVCMRKPCGHPGDIQFGSFELLEDTEFLFGSRVVYKCDEGYRLASPINFRVCEADGWTNDVPFCEVVKCSPVTAPQNGKISTSSLDPDQEFTFGQVVQFECNPGFKLKGPREIHCSADGDWSEQNPQCVGILCELPDIENGNLLAAKAIYKENERLQYTCNPGFAHSERGDATCTKNGWIPVMSCKEITCPPPHLANGNIYPQKDKYRGSDEILYHCKKGFYPPLTGNKAKCTPEGWLPLPRCNLRPCEYPEIENGFIYKPYWQTEKYYRSLFPQSIGKIMYYRCNENYVAAQRSYSDYWTTFSCTEEGWSPVPECLRVCYLHSVENGNFWPRKISYMEGDEITIQCIYGYSLPNNQEKITCTRQGWSTDTDCREKRMCTVKSYFENGFFSESKLHYPVNTEARYQCKEGYATTDGKKEGFITCGQQGWLNQPQCIKICDIPQFEYARYKGSKAFLKPNERLEYECMDGYEITSGETTGVKVCGVDEWPTIIECYEKLCRLPILQYTLYPNPTANEYKVGDVLTFRCSSGLKLVGSPFVQCYHFGWSPSIPTCEQKVECCEQPPEIVNGTPKDSNNKTYCHSDVVEYNCDLGFVKRGPKKIQCNNGEWTTLPTCIEEKRRCAELPKLVHGHVQTHNLSYFHGASVEYGCEEGFTMVGRKTVTCDQGNWTQLPKCIETHELGRCASTFFEDLQVNLHHNEYNEVIVDYRCNWNSEVRSTTCVHGRWYPEPQCPKMKSCAPPPQIPNAQNMSTTVNYEDGEKIGVFCKENYLLQGQEEIICKNGQWDSLPRCIEKKPCSKPPAIQYGAIKEVRSSEVGDDNLESNTYAHNTTVNYSCDEGFKMIGREEITCNMGKWSPSPQCIGISCGKPPKIQNGAVLKELDTYEFGDRVTYKCYKGFNIDGPAAIKCIGGTWSNPPQCKDMRCSAPLKFNNADMIGVSKPHYFPGDKVTYQCLPNYQTEGSTEVTCIGGFWKGNPQCKDYSCGYPPQIENGEIISNIKARYEAGETVSYKCIRQLKIYGNPDIVCINKTWTELPQCKEEVGKCGPPPPINNGDITSFALHEYAPGSRVEYRCQKYYVLQGSPTVTCRNGLWTREPTCLEACTISKEMMMKNNIELRWLDAEKIYSKTGEMTEFVCIRGFRKAPRSPPFRARCSKGNINYPRCI
ncbi:complement factor H [Trichosurus vulpecula]|uniref:complement factor H n=1 Tax=Trichosurus vulpecula TaxID=9337 RepID=UPI00186B3412|nr:complement factor H [Trichosurus vulpecula]